MLYNFYKCIPYLKKVIFIKLYYMYIYLFNLLVIHNIQNSLLHRKISAHEFERGGLLKPIVNTIDGTPTFLSIAHSPSDPTMGCGTTANHPSMANSVAHHRPQRLSRNELRHLDEKQLIFELVRYRICDCVFGFSLWAGEMRKYNSGYGVFERDTLT